MLTEESILQTLLQGRMRLSAAVWIVVREAQAAEDSFQNVMPEAMTGRATFTNGSSGVPRPSSPPAAKALTGGAATDARWGDWRMAFLTRWTASGRPTPLPGFTEGHPPVAE